MSEQQALIVPVLSEDWQEEVRQQTALRLAQAAEVQPSARTLSDAYQLAKAQGYLGILWRFIELAGNDDGAGNVVWAETLNGKQMRGVLDKDCRITIDVNGGTVCSDAKREFVFDFWLVDVGLRYQELSKAHADGAAREVVAQSEQRELDAELKQRLADRQMEAALRGRLAQRY